MATSKGKEAKAEKEEVVVETKKSTPQKPKVVEDKFVTVKPTFSGNRKIGGRWYEFTKNKEIKVTQDAKRVLTEARAIYLS